MILSYYFGVYKDSNKYLVNFWVLFVVKILNTDQKLSFNPFLDENFGGLSDMVISYTFEIFVSVIGSWFQSHLNLTNSSSPT